MITEKLQKFGLSEKEALVYDSLLGTVAGTASDIAKKAGVNRSTAYVLLESLAKQGLASMSGGKGVKVFSPAPPDKLVQIAEDSRNKFDKLAELGRELVSEFKNFARKNSATKPVIQIFEGVEGVKNIFEDALSARPSVVRILSLNMASAKKLPDYLSAYYPRATRKNIKIKILANDTKSVRETILSGPQGDTSEYFLIPQGVSNEKENDSEMLIWGNKIAFISDDLESAYMLEHRNFADILSTIFDLSLEKAKRWNVKSQPQGQKISQKHSPILVRATKRFWKIK